MKRTHEYTAQELHDLMVGKDILTYQVRWIPELDDVRFEDTEDLEISLPRGLWRILRDAAKMCNCPVDEMASDMICNQIWAMIERRVPA